MAKKTIIRCALCKEILSKEGLKFICLSTNGYQMYLCFYCHAILEEFFKKI